MSIHVEMMYYRYETEMPFCGSRSQLIALGCSDVGPEETVALVANRLVDRMLQREVTLLVVQGFSPAHEANIVALTLEFHRQAREYHPRFARELQIHYEIVANDMPTFGSFAALEPVFADLYVTVDHAGGGYDLLEDITVASSFPEDQLYARCPMGRGLRTELDPTILDYVLPENTYLYPYPTFRSGSFDREAIRKNLLLCREQASRHGLSLSYQPDLYLGV